MTLEKLDWLNRFKAIEHEYRVAVIAMRRLADQALNDPTILDSDMKVRGIGEASSRLNGTYSIHLFAEFETGLRQFWCVTRIEPEPRGVAEIIDRIAARHGIAGDDLNTAHRSRKYRNRQIHDGEEVGEVLDSGLAQSSWPLFSASRP